MTVQLRPYQEKAVQELRAAFAAGHRSVLFVLPTGGGKTYTYSAIAEGAAKRNNRVVILEHRKELIRQASVSCGSIGIRHQIIAPPAKVADIRRVHVERIGWPMVDRDAHVSVASVQTLVRRLDWLKAFIPNLIIIDEAHHATAGSWAKIIEACPDARLLGVTATPCRTDGVGLGDVFTAMVLGPSMGELIEMGSLVRPRVFSLPMLADTSSVHMTKGDYNAKELAVALDTPTITGDAVKHYSTIAPGRPAIVFCVSVKHAEHVAAQFRAAGWRFEIVVGDMDDDLRDSRIMGLADGRLHGIVTVDVVSEGTDIPVAEVAILLRPTESEALYLQQCGRVLRPADGKEYGLILDHVGNVIRHGMPDADRVWKLEGRQPRGKGEKLEKDNLRVLQCPICYGADVPRKICGCIKPDGTICQHEFKQAEYQIKHVEGELVEMESTAPAKVQTGQLRDMEQMKAAGLSTQRARHILAARAEKERLQSQLKDLLMRSGAHASAIYAVRDMKPKQLREEIERVGQNLFFKTEGEVCVE